MRNIRLRSILVSIIVVAIGVTIGTLITIRAISYARDRNLQCIYDLQCIRDSVYYTAQVIGLVLLLILALLLIIWAALLVIWLSRGGNQITILPFEVFSDEE